MDAAKRGGREKHHVILAAGSSSAKSIDVAAKNRTPSSRIAAGEVASSVAACLSRLPDRDQTAIRMRYFDGHSLAEIGQTLGLTQQAVSMALKRAILRLRREMGGESQFF